MVARCIIDYTGRLTTHLAEATRLLMMERPRVPRERVVVGDHMPRPHLPADHISGRGTRKPRACRCSRLVS
jgi:hypothetical protein